MGQAIKIRLTVEEREELEGLVGRPTEEAGLVRRARVILLTDRGVSGLTVGQYAVHGPVGCRSRLGGLLNYCCRNAA
jgi:hypothetical protein